MTYVKMMIFRPDIDAEAFEADIQEAEKLSIDRQSAFKDGISHGARYYSLD